MKSLNPVTLVGRLGADAKITTLRSGKKVANFSVATDASYFSQERNKWVERTGWHSVVTYQQGLIAKVLEKHGKKGRLGCCNGATQETREYQKDGDKRWITEVLLTPMSSQMDFLDKLPEVQEDDLPPIHEEVPPADFNESDIPF